MFPSTGVGKSLSQAVMRTAQFVFLGELARQRLGLIKRKGFVARKQQKILSAPFAEVVTYPEVAEMATIVRME